jgi:hypothetical protein
MPLRPVVRALAASLALGACESSTAPEPMGGVWVVQSAEGRPLPASVDTIFRTDGSIFAVDQVIAGSLEFLNADSARYILFEQSVVYSSTRGDSLRSGRCLQMNVPYRVHDSRVLLIVEPILYNQPGPLRLDTLRIGDGRLVQDTRSRRNLPLHLEYAPGSQPAQCISEAQ